MFFFARMIIICLGTTITGILAILIFTLIMWIWTGVGLTFLLILKSFLLTFCGAFLAITITTFFILFAQSLNISSSLAIVPTLFLFYILPFVVYFTAQFNYVNASLQELTFMRQLAVMTDFLIQPPDGLQEILNQSAMKKAWAITMGTSGGSELIAFIFFIQIEK
ncbi:MAG: hypothetical protein U9O98_10095 [Asgard group archaeon]|nr:hypothetical protein [Asgard group archaeon]